MPTMQQASRFYFLPYRFLAGFVLLYALAGWIINMVVTVQTVQEVIDTTLILHFVLLALYFLAVVLGLVGIFARVRGCYIPVLILFALSAAFYVYSTVVSILGHKEVKYSLHYAVLALNNLVLVVVFCLLYRDDKPDTGPPASNPPVETA
jgi:hypothetical protein